MLWYLPWSESIKKRACRYLLQRYLGNYLEEKLTLDQLSVDLYNGTGTVSDVSLDCEALNELGDSQNWPLEIVDGQMKEITVTVPWSTLLKDDSVVEINGLSLTVQPKVRPEPASSMLESMWSSMSSSMQLAAECLREEAGPQESNPVEGIEMFAHAIDSILSRVKVKFVNTKIRIEHVPKNGDKGIALEVHIENIDYFDEAGTEPSPETTDPDKTKTYIVSTYTNKKIKFNGVVFNIDEFPSKLRTMAPSLMEKSASSVDRSDGASVDTPNSNYQSTMSDVFYETRSVMSTIDSDPVKEIIEERHIGSARESTPPDRTTQADPILFAKLTGQQELALKLKHSEEVEGPKVEVKILLGSFLIFITPRQMRTIIELVDALNQPHLEDTSNIPVRPSNINMQCKPMKQADFQLIEAQLLGNLDKQQAKPSNMYGWSGPSFEDGETDEKFLPMTSQGLMSESFTSSISSMSNSMTSSMNISSQPRIKRNKKVPHIEGDPTAEVSHISLRVASISCVLLHKDILAPTPLSLDSVSYSSAYKMQQVATEFFNRIETFSKFDERRNIHHVNDSLDAATDRDHLRLLMSEISVDGSEKVTSHGSHTVCEAAVHEALLRECLYHEGQRQTYDLIRFDRGDEDTTVSTKSNIRMNFKQTSKYISTSGERKLVYPTTDIVLKCTPFYIDVDLTLLERMSSTFFGGPPPPPSPHVASPSNKSQNQVNFSLQCPNLDIILRFPIADLRPGGRSEARSVRPDYLLFKLHNTNVGLQQLASARPLPTTISIRMTTLDLYYYVCTYNPLSNLNFSSIIDQVYDKIYTYISIIYDCQEEDIIIPGTEEEMREFTNSSVEHSAIHLDFSLPILSLQLESKQLYEILYNRISSELLLWSPREEFDIAPPPPPSFEPCRGGYDSDSESSSSQEDNLYYSTYDNKLKKGIGNTRPFSDIRQCETHNFCLTFNVDKGLLSILAPVRDSNKRVVPGQMGELVLEAHKLSMCQVSGLYGKAKTAQMCLRAAKATLYHEPLLTIPSDRPPLRLYGSVLPSHLKKTIYPSNKGVIIKDRLKPKDMFTMALKTEPDTETPNLKTICIALGIEQATLRHRGDKGIAWLSQLLDVLDVIDYPVPGYTPSPVLSELHVHVWDCAVDYRPLYLPIRSVVTLGNFSVSSNLIPETNTSYLRFLAQECSLHLSYLHSKTVAPDDRAPDLHKEYVCVIDVGLFELSLRMEDKSNGSQDHPQVDLTASNNMVTMFTCWDSASALCRLLTYVASDGDSQTYDSRHTSLCSDQPLEQLVGLEDRPIEEIRELSPSEIQQVNDLMAEAMKESPNNTIDDEDFVSSTEKEGVELFYFPDESNVKQKQLETADAESETKSVEYEDMSHVEEAQEATPTNMQVARDLGDPTVTPKSTPKKSKRKKMSSCGSGSNTDDEYCVVEQLAGDMEMEEPVVTWLAGPVTMLNDHFSVPPAKSDVLAAPKSFPPPVLRYTLCELSLTWNMFGGSDFKPKETSKKSVSIDDPRGGGSPVSSARSKDYEPYESRRSLASSYRHGVSWSAGTDRVRATHTRKNDSRDHHTCVKLCLTKVKFQHEVYPPGCTQASRQTLAIAKIEVLDRLVCSDINKLLSQYKLKDEPERKNAHMLIVKAVHLRADASLPVQECCLKVSLLPLQFNLDQDTLAFLVDFFSKLGSDETNEEDTKSLGAVSTESGSRQSTPTHRPPVMSVGAHLKDPPPTPTSLGDADCLSLNETVIRDDEPLMETYEAERLVSENLIQLEEDFQRLGISHEKPTTKVQDCEPVDDSPIYFRRVVFSPEVPIRLDYVGKRVDLSAGPVAGLLMGLGQLNCSELTLKRLDYKLGLLGLEKLVQWALHEWLSDIKRHQLPGLLSGIGPMHSLLQIITGIRDLVWLPVEQWRRDGRLVHGLRRGAASFTARTAVAALDITARILHLIQATAETAVDMLTPAPALPLSTQGRRRRRDRTRQPADIREGVTSAYNTVKEGFAETAASLSAAARRGKGAGVLRQLPGAAVAPLALAAAGAADVLGGVRAHLAPHTTRDHADKWRRPFTDTTD
nr:autophagy-related protein 2 homolog A [Danaus plexippus plexippus]